MFDLTYSNGKNYISNCNYSGRLDYGYVQTALYTLLSVFNAENAARSYRSVFKRVHYENSQCSYCSNKMPFASWFLCRNLNGGTYLFTKFIFDSSQAWLKVMCSFAVTYDVALLWSFARHIAPLPVEIPDLCMEVKKKSKGVSLSKANLHIYFRGGKRRVPAFRGLLCKLIDF